MKTKWIICTLRFIQSNIHFIQRNIKICHAFYVKVLFHRNTWDDITFMTPSKGLIMASIYRLGVQPVSLTTETQLQLLSNEWNIISSIMGFVLLSPWFLTSEADKDKLYLGKRLMFVSRSHFSVYPFKTMLLLGTSEIIPPKKPFKTKLSKKRPKKLLYLFTLGLQPLI